MVFLACKYSKPSNICFTYTLINVSLNFPYLSIKLEIVPPFTHSKIILDDSSLLAGTCNVLHKNIDSWLVSRCTNISHYIFMIKLAQQINLRFQRIDSLLSKEKYISFRFQNSALVTFLVVSAFNPPGICTCFTAMSAPFSKLRPKTTFPNDPWPITSASFHLWRKIE